MNDENKEDITPQAISATKPKRWPRTTAQQRAEWARKFAQSGLGQREFCREHGLVLVTLQRWLARVEGPGPQSPNARPEPHFTEVKLISPPGPDRWAAELNRPNGWTLRLAHDVPPGLIEQLLRLC
jgi:hypothetical protein